MLNPAIDWDEIRNSYATDNFVLIRDILEPGKAEEIFRTLDNEVEWETSLLGKNGREIYTSAELKAMSPAQKGELMSYIQARAAKGFAYFYLKHDLNTTKIPLLSELVNYVSSPKFLGFIKYVTEEYEITRAGGQASCYRSLTFLNEHNDKTDLEDRKVAYVMGFTRIWRPDFGGLLHIMNDDGSWNVHIPQFNCLTIFKVPRNHFVSQVANYTRVPRYTVNGWFTKS